MKILALEFSSPRRSVAVLDGAAVLAEQSETGGQDLPPLRMVEQALAEARLERGQIECVAVGLGPGSYTGIRSAIALAQGWQLAAGVKLTGISSADCIAAQARAEGVFGQVNVVIDAQRGEFYLNQYEISKNEAKQASELKIVTLTDVNKVFESGGMLIGPEIDRWVGSGKVIFPTAAASGRLAFEEKRFVSGERLEPIYLRATAFVKAAPSRVLPRL